MCDTRHHAPCMECDVETRVPHDAGIPRAARNLGVTCVACRTRGECGDVAWRARMDQNDRLSWDWMMASFLEGRARMREAKARAWAEEQEWLSTP